MINLLLNNQKKILGDQIVKDLQKKFEVMNSEKGILFSKQQKNCKRTNNKWSRFMHKNSQDSYRKYPLKKIPRGIIRGQLKKNLDS